MAKTYTLRTNVENVFLKLSFGDLAPNYAGTLFGIGNAISCVGAIIGPYIVGIITQEEVGYTHK